MLRSTSRLRSLLDRLPPRVWAWALLALTLFPLGFLTRNGSAYFLYPLFASAALLMTVPPGVPRWTVDWRLLTPLLLLFFWGLATFLWTTALGQAAVRWSSALFLSVLTILGYGAASEATAAERRLITRALLVGFIIGFAMLASERVTEGALYVLRYPDHEGTDAYSQASAPLVVFSLAAFALAGCLTGPQRVLPILGTLALSLIFQHWAGVAGIVGAGIVWVLARCLPRLRRWIWGAIMLLLLLVAPFQGLLIQKYWPADGKPRDVEVREQIWRFGAERILEKPILGWGFAASYNLPDTGEVSLRHTSKKVISNHPHNVFLQVWLELGIPGMLLGGWFLFALITRVRRPLAQAILAYILVQGWVSAGLWPSRWLAMACVGVLLYRLVVPPAPQRSLQQEPGGAALARAGLPGHP
jgi:O-antigen ligase